MSSLYSKLINPTENKIFTHKLDLNALKQAIDENNVNKVIGLIRGVNPDELNQKIEYLGTPLFGASMRGQMEIVKLLLKAGANPNIVNEYGTPLCMAAYEHQTKIVKLLLKAGADPNIAGHYNKTPLIEASLMGGTDVVKLLLAAGADPKITDSSGDNPLITAARNDYTKLVELLLSAGIDPNIFNKNDETPLFTASDNNHIKTVKLLLSAGADPNIANIYNESPLYIAAKKDHTKIVKLLLAAGADPNIADGLGDTPFDIASARKYTELVNIFKSWKPLNPNKFDKNGKTTFMKLIIKGYYPTFIRLLPKVENLNAQDNDGNTALHYAILYKRKNMVHDLLKKYASTNIANKTNEIPMYYAIKNLKESQDDTYLRELYRASRAFLYEGGYYQEARSSFIKALGQEESDPLLVNPSTLNGSALTELANAFSLFKEDDWDLSELYEEIEKIQIVLKCLSPEEREKYLEDLYIRYIKINYT